MWRPCLTWAATLAVASFLGCAAAPSDDRTTEAANGVFLPFLNAPSGGQPLADVPRLHVSAAGGPATSAEMDTGSTGVLLATRLIPDWEKLPTAGRARLIYSSSGRIMEGRWVITPVTVSGKDGAAITTEPMPVMAVTGVSCLPEARDCEPETSPTHVAMLGIGFARQADHQAQGTPDHNPFLRLPAMADGALGRGYVVTRTGVQIGLRRSGPDLGFATVELVRSSVYPDWSVAPACITVADGAHPSCGTVLVDTGVSRMFLTVSEDQLQGQTQPGPSRAPMLAPGACVAVDLKARLPDGTSLGYAFEVGDGSDTLGPSGVTLVGTGQRAPFVNTSFHLLNGFDYLFDADHGLVGYRLTRSRPQMCGPGRARQ